MGIIIRWDNPEKTVLRYQYEGKWSWEELYKALEQAHRMVDQANQPVGVLIDITASEALPPNALAHARSIRSREHPNMVFTVVVGASRLIRVMTDSFLRIYGASGGYSNIRFTDTLDEARLILQNEMHLTQHFILDEAHDDNSVF